MTERIALLMTPGEQFSDMFTPSTEVLLAGVSDQSDTFTGMGFPFLAGVCYRGAVQHLAYVMFFKALVLSFWVAFQEARQRGAIDRAWADLVARFNREWDRRRAKQPLVLTDQRSEVAKGLGALEQ